VKTFHGSCHNVLSPLPLRHFCVAHGAFLPFGEYKGIEYNISILAASVSDCISATHLANELLTKIIIESRLANEFNALCPAGGWKMWENGRGKMEKKRRSSCPTANDEMMKRLLGLMSRTEIKGNQLKAAVESSLKRP